MAAFAENKSRCRLVRSAIICKGCDERICRGTTSSSKTRVVAGKVGTCSANFRRAAGLFARQTSAISASPASKAKSLRAADASCNATCSAVMGSRVHFYQGLAKLPTPCFGSASINAPYELK